MKLHNKVNREVLKEQLASSELARTTLSFYKYVHIEAPEVWRNKLYKGWAEFGVFGRVYIAREGVNGQVSVPTDRLEAFREHLYGISFLKGIRLNVAIEDDGKSFYKLIVKVRDKIVADGLEEEGFDVTDGGQHIDAVQFNQLAEKLDTVIVDMRNHYETEVGHFEEAILPDTETFREALEKVEDILEGQQEKHIVMYCTGGIRCEKASAYYKYRGFKYVYQLDGGIIEYAREVKRLGLENKFKGKNFVFDERMGERIGEGVLARCHQCGSSCDMHVNCRNDACHLLFIQCMACGEQYEGCCSAKCCGFIALPEEEQRARRKEEVFNGTRFGKGRYKSHKGGVGLG